MPSKKAIVIGAGIVGVAVARSLAEKGYAVTVFERNEKSVGASIRNFGMIWPIGQPDGILYERALRTKSIWKEIAKKAGLWFEEKGSLHLAYNDLELQVLNEFADINRDHRPVELLSPEETIEKTGAVNPNNLRGALFSADEMVIESRVAMEKLPHYLKEKYGVQFYFNTAISSITYPYVFSGKRQWNADLIFVCSGSDFETLYPEIYLQNALTKCKLQMMRFCSQPKGWRIGPSLCGGLSLIHYKSFAAAPSISLLKEHFQENMAAYVRWGIHVMVSQNGEGELTIGDSHEYGLVHDPFDKQFINELITDYLKGFVLLKDWRLSQSWNGIYPKCTRGSAEFICHPEDGVTIINGLSGAGMTLSFGLAEEIINGMATNNFNNTLATIH